MPMFSLRHCLKDARHYISHLYIIRMGQGVLLEEGCRKARLGVRASSTLPWIRLTFSVYPRKLMYPLPTTPLLSYELHHSFLVSLNLREVESFSGGFTVSVPEILANSGYGFRDVNDAAR